jgi:hypothetical protein
MEPARSVDDLTEEWVAGVLQASGAIESETKVEEVRAEVKQGQLADLIRLELSYGGAAGYEAPRSLIVKLAAESEASRQTAVALGLYEREVFFYRELAETVQVEVPRCHLADFDPAEGWFTLVLDDVSASAEAGRMLEGGTADQAGVALAELAKLQGPRWGDPKLRELSWLADPAPTRMLFSRFSHSAPRFLADLGSSLSSEHVSLIEHVVPSAVQWLDTWEEPLVVSHGDYRLDNMLFGTGKGAPPVTVVDWQWARLAPPTLDAAFYLGGCLPRDLRREVERDLLMEYHAALEARGVEGYGFERLWDDYRRHCLYGLLVAVGAYEVESDNLARKLFVFFARQYADLALDLESTELTRA